MKNERTYKLVLAAVLVAIEVMMALTPLGYLNIGLLSISFLTLPVILGASLLGIGGGALMGAVFGLTSFVQCFGLNALGTFLLSLNGIGAFVTMFVSRTLMGLLVGLLYAGMKKLGLFSHIAASLAAPLLNTMLFMTSFIIFFRNADLSVAGIAGLGDLAAISIWDIFMLFAGVNAVVELFAVGLLGGVISPVCERLSKRFK